MDISGESFSEELEEEMTVSESEGESEVEQEVGICFFFSREAFFHGHMTM
jgi:hypothetical protein